MLTIKNLPLLIVLSSVQLFSMEIELSKKPDKTYSFKEVLFFVNHIVHNGYKQIQMPKEIGGEIVRKSYLLRMDEIYKKFDSFFRFDSESYHILLSRHIADKYAYIEKHSLLTKTNVKRFHELYPAPITICRQFDAIEPRHLLSSTKAQDEILLSLIFRPKCFYNDKGYFSLQLTEEENEKFLKLPPELIAMFDTYPRFIFPNISYKGVALSDEWLDMDMTF